MDKTKVIKELEKLTDKAMKRNEVPIAAIIVKNNKIIAKSYNKKNLRKCSLYHAEILCIIKACKKLHTWNLSDCDMYVSLYPCDMCKEVISESRINNVCYLYKKGNINNKYNNTKYEQMFMTNESNNKLSDFFKIIRKKK